MSVLLPMHVPESVGFMVRFCSYLCFSERVSLSASAFESVLEVNVPTLSVSGRMCLTHRPLHVTDPSSCFVCLLTYIAVLLIGLVLFSRNRCDSVCLIAVSLFPNENILVAWSTRALLALDLSRRDARVAHTFKSLILMTILDSTACDDTFWLNESKQCLEASFSITH